MVLAILSTLVFFEKASAQNVGIGTSSPLQKLHIAGTSSTLRLEGIGTGGSFLSLPSSTTDRIVFANTSGDLYSIPNGSNGQYLTINGSGIPQWITPTDQSTDWTVTGNSGLSVLTNFIGTTDPVDFIMKAGGTERLRLYNTGGALLSNVLSGGNALKIDMTNGVAANSTGLLINNFPSNTNARIGVSIDMLNVTGSTGSSGLSISNIGVTNTYGIDINSDANGNGTGIRIGGNKTLGTGINILGGTGVLYNASSSGSGTGIKIGGSAAPGTGVDAKSAGSNNVGGQFQATNSGDGVLGMSISGSAPATVNLIGVRGYAQTNSGTNADFAYGLYGSDDRGGTINNTSVSYGVYGLSNINSSTNAGLNIGVSGIVTNTGLSATAGGIGGFFKTTNGAQYLSLATSGGDVYLGSTDVDRPSGFTSFANGIGSGNTNTTYLYSARVSGSLIFRQTNIAGSNTATFAAPSSITTSYILTLPTAQGGTSTVLTNDGSGNLSWSNASTLVLANNGLTTTGTSPVTIQLGGTLIQNTTITQGNFDLTHTLSGTGNSIFNMTNTGNIKVQKSGTDVLTVYSSNSNVGINTTLSPNTNLKLVTNGGSYADNQVSSVSMLSGSNAPFSNTSGSDISAVEAGFEPGNYRVDGDIEVKLIVYYTTTANANNFQLHIYNSTGNYYPVTCSGCGTTWTYTNVNGSNWVATSNWSEFNHGTSSCEIILNGWVDTGTCTLKNVYVLARPKNN